MADFWQQVVAQRTQELYESDEYADKAEELLGFQEKLTEGKELYNIYNGYIMIILCHIILYYVK